MGSTSSSTRHRRKSPTLIRRDLENTTPHIPHAELLANRGLQGEVLGHGSSQEESVSF